MKKDEAGERIRNAPDAPEAAAAAPKANGAKPPRRRRGDHTDILAGVEFWRTPDDQAMVSVPIGDHCEHLQVETAAIRTWLVQTAYRVRGVD